MAELICTDEEKAAASYLDWDDAALGRACKKIALVIAEKDGGRDSVQVTAAAMFLVAKAVDAGSDHSTIRLDGLYDGSKQLGDWRISMVRIDNSVQPVVDGVNQVSGFTEGESKCHDMLLAATGAFCDLDRQHPDELREFTDAIHRLQDLLAVRIVRRCYPDFWPVKK